MHPCKLIYLKQEILWDKVAWLSLGLGAKKGCGKTDEAKDDQGLAEG